jgi:hypothetical protein
LSRLDVPLDANRWKMTGLRFRNAGAPACTIFYVRRISTNE